MSRAAFSDYLTTVLLTMLMVGTLQTNTRPYCFGLTFRSSHLPLGDPKTHGPNAVSPVNLLLEHQVRLPWNAPTSIRLSCLWSFLPFSVPPFSLSPYLSMDRAVDIVIVIVIFLSVLCILTVGKSDTFLVLLRICWMYNSVKSEPFL